METTSLNAPRITTDPDLLAALKAWENASPFRDSVYDDAMLLRESLRNTDSHQAYGWAALTCGRIAAHRQQVQLAEILLTEALGQFFLVNDKYGEAMTIAHLALPHIARGNLDRALELALRPMSSEIAFSSADKTMLHNIAMQCYWAKEEPHPAILHAMKALELTQAAGDGRRRSTVLGNTKPGNLHLEVSSTTRNCRCQYCQTSCLFICIKRTMRRHWKMPSCYWGIWNRLRVPLHPPFLKTLLMHFPLAAKLTELNIAWSGPPSSN